jgi:BlaI family penicillinase repressor
LWRRGPLSFVSLIEEVKAGQPLADATIKTLLHRLIQKGAVKSVKEDGRQRYHAQIDREAYVAGEVALLVQRLFGDDIQALKAFLDSRSS